MPAIDLTEFILGFQRLILDNAAGICSRGRSRSFIEPLRGFRLIKDASRVVETSAGLLIIAAELSLG